MNIDEGMTAGPTAAQIPRPAICPDDVLPLCCPHLRGGPGGGGVDEAMRSMRYHALRLQNGGYLDTWMCYACGLDISRDDISQYLDVPRSRCLGDHGWQAVMLDMRLAPPAVVGSTCVIPVDTFLQPLRCDEPIVTHDAVNCGASLTQLEVNSSGPQSQAVVEVVTVDDDHEDDAMDELRDLVQQHRDEDFAELQRLVWGWSDEEF